MGWASGNEIFDPVAETLIIEGASDALKKSVCSALIKALRDRDWDTEDESLGMFEHDEAIVEAFRQNGIILECHEEHPENPWQCEEERNHCGSHRDDLGNTWTDLGSLDRLISKFVQIDKGSECEFQGVVTNVQPVEQSNGKSARIVEMEHDGQWGFVYQQTAVKVTENPEGE
ncbi:hypothetical protein ABT282_08165 [Streptomyces sp. NPDC000927]|uniref:hypothetical protein n=1 Tax=Streptomyces sp. NPDC000927 TaxID=3154371 RepID=UPI00332640D2